MSSMGMFLRGMMMGAADIVPGVSGGTIAFITGIYDTLLGSIRAVDLVFLRKLFALDIRDAWEHVNGGFLLALLLGIATSIFSLARLISWVLENHPVPLWAFFFGLILASALVLLRQVETWTAPRLLCLLVGVAVALSIALSPMMSLDVGLAGVFLSGFLAICAMILPGISGSFILLLLGKYEFVISAVNTRDIPSLMLIAIGAVIGLVTLAQLLAWLFKHYHDVTIAVLIGFMAGSLRKIWPWKEVVETAIDRHGEEVPIVLNTVLPPMSVSGAYNTEILAALAIAAVGFGVVLLLERIGSRTR